MPPSKKSKPKPQPKKTATVAAEPAQASFSFGNHVPANNQKHTIDAKPLPRETVPAVQTVEVVRGEPLPPKPTPADAEAYKMYRDASRDTRRLVFMVGLMLIAFVFHIQYHARLIEMMPPGLKGVGLHRNVISGALGLTILVVTVFLIDSARHTRALRRLCAPYLYYLHRYPAGHVHRTLGRFRSFIGVAIYYVPFVIVLIFAADDIGLFFFSIGRGLLNQFLIGPWQ